MVTRASYPPKPSLGAVIVSGDREWAFQYNPQNLARSLSVRKSSTPTINGVVPVVQMNGIEGDTLSITDCLILGVGEFDGLDELLVNGAPVEFRWGDRFFAPAIVTKLDWTETEWDPESGEATALKFSVTLERTTGTTG